MWCISSLDMRVLRTESCLVILYASSPTIGGATWVMRNLDMMLLCGKL